MENDIDEKPIPALNIEWVPGTSTYNVNLGETYLAIYPGGFFWHAWDGHKLLVKGSMSGFLQNGHGEPIDLKARVPMMKLSLEEKRAGR
jgi:hypothetical protein